MIIIYFLLIIIIISICINIWLHIFQMILSKIQQGFFGMVSLRSVICMILVPFKVGSWNGNFEFCNLHNPSAPRFFGSLNQFMWDSIARFHPKKQKRWLIRFCLIRIWYQISVSYPLFVGKRNWSPHLPPSWLNLLYECYGNNLTDLGHYIFIEWHMWVG